MEGLLLEQRLLIEKLRWWRSPDEIVSLSDELYRIAEQIAQSFTATVSRSQ